jgi:NADH dehydrogenase/NADH:ubiquinone oxidoreductase subunit G
MVAQAFGVELAEAAQIDQVKALVAFRTDGLPLEKLARMEVLVAIAQNEPIEAHVTLPCKSVYEQDGTLVNWYGRLQRTWPSLMAQRGDAAPGWLWAERILAGLGFTHQIRSPAAAFALLAARLPELASLTLDRIDEQGVVLESRLPREWPRRAPRPAPRPQTRGPQTTPPGMKVGDEASGGSR